MRFVRVRLRLRARCRGARVRRERGSLPCLWFAWCMPDGWERRASRGTLHSALPLSSACARRSGSSTSPRARRPASRLLRAVRHALGRAAASCPRGSVLRRSTGELISKSNGCEVLGQGGFEMARGQLAAVERRHGTSSWEPSLPSCGFTQNAGFANQ